MATEILMPALSPTMEEGTLAKWLKKEGDEVWHSDLSSFRAYVRRDTSMLVHSNCSVPMDAGERCPFVCDYPFIAGTDHNALVCKDGGWVSDGFCAAPCYGQPSLPEGARFVGPRLSRLIS